MIVLLLLVVMPRVMGPLYLILRCLILVTMLWSPVGNTHTCCKWTGERIREREREKGGEIGGEGARKREDGKERGQGRASRARRWMKRGESQKVGDMGGWGPGKIKEGMGGEGAGKWKGSGDGGAREKQGGTSAGK